VEAGIGLAVVLGGVFVVGLGGGWFLWLSAKMWGMSEGRGGLGVILGIRTCGNLHDVRVTYGILLMSS